MKNVKTILAVLLLCAITLFTVLSSCSKESTSGSTSVNTNESTNERRIIGKWECVKSWYAVGNDPANISPNQYLYEESDYNRIGDIWEFSNDGIMKWNNEPVTYTLTEDDLLMGGLFSFHIHELTNTSLKVWTKILYFGSDEDHIRMIEFQKVR